MNQHHNERTLASREEAPASLPEMDNSILSSYPPIGTLEQAASILQIGITTARQLCREGRLPAFKVAHQWRVPRAWLTRFIAEGGSHE